MTVNEWASRIKRALKKVRRWNSGLEFVILNTASGLRTLELANNEIDALDAVTVEIELMHGTKVDVHPAFKVQRDAMECINRQLKTLGLTTEDLMGEMEADPLVDLTKKLTSIDGTAADE